MKFTVFARSTVDGEESTRSHNGRFQILEGGVLRVDPEGGRPSELYSPSAWVNVVINADDESVYESRSAIIV